MKRITKIIERDPIIPELGYLVFSELGAIVWTGAIGVRFDLGKAGSSIAKLVKQHGSFAIIDALRFIKIATALDKAAESVRLDPKTSMLRIVMSGKRGDIDIPVAREVPENIPHLEIDWSVPADVDKVHDHIKLDTVWLDAVDLIGRDGINLWGDVIGVYDAPEWTAAFDYGILLYHNKNGHKKNSAHEIEEVLFCPLQLLEIGLTGMTEAIFTEDELFINGDGVTYYTKPAIQPHVLESALQARDDALSGNEHKVKLDFTSGLWKRAKLFSSLALELTIAGGRMTLSGDNWQEVIGTTDAPDAKFITRISLLERWTIGTTGHTIRIKEDEWYLLGNTRKGSEFYGTLTNLGTESFDDPENEVPLDDYRGGSSEGDDDGALLG